MDFNALNWPALLTALGWILTTIFQELRFRQNQPRANAAADVSLQGAIIQALAAQNLNTANAQRVNSDLALSNSKQAETIASQNVTIRDLVTKIDGLPTRIAEQTAQLLVQEGYILAQRKALVEAGVPINDQPVEQLKITLTELTPPTLLDDLAREKAGAQAPPADAAKDALIASLQAELAAAKIQP